MDFKKRQLGSTSRPAGPELIAELQRSLSHLSYDEKPVPELSIESLGIKKAQKFFKKVGKTLDEKKMRSLGLLTTFADKVVPTLGGLILFGSPEARQRYVPDAEVWCARFRGTDKSEFLDRYEVDGTILDAIEALPNFIARNTRLAAEIKSMQRKDIPEYSPLAIREVLVNALAHCDYSLTGAHIQIAIFSNRLEIQNPGMLPFGFALDNFKAGVSRLRNRVIARVFSELRLMEEWGSGYKRIVDTCLKEGYEVPLWEEIGAFLRVSFSPHEKTISDSEKKISPKRELLQRQKTVLSLFSVGEELSFRSLREKMPISISDRSLRYDLAHLKENGFLISKERGRAAFWKRIV